MKHRSSFTFAVALIGGLFAISASGSDAKIDVEPSAPLQLAFLQLPDSRLSSPVLPWAVLALFTDASALVYRQLDNLSLGSSARPSPKRARDAEPCVRDRIHQQQGVP